MTKEDLLARLPEGSTVRLSTIDWGVVARVTLPGGRTYSADGEWSNTAIERLASRLVEAGVIILEAA